MDRHQLGRECHHHSRREESQGAVWHRGKETPVPNQDPRRSRDITLEPGLLLKLKAWHAKTSIARFIFGTSSDLPNGHFLETCKEAARRAGLSCKQCQGCLDRNECEKWFLHKFRATFATWASGRGGHPNSSETNGPYQTRDDSPGIWLQRRGKLLRKN
jgi:integrase